VIDLPLAVLRAIRILCFFQHSARPFFPFSPRILLFECGVDTRTLTITLALVLLGLLTLMTFDEVSRSVPILHQSIIGAWAWVRGWWDAKLFRLGCTRQHYRIWRGGIVGHGTVEWEVESVLPWNCSNSVELFELLQNFTPQTHFFFPKCLHFFKMDCNLPPCVLCCCFRLRGTLTSEREASFGSVPRPC